MKNNLLILILCSFYPMLVNAQASLAAEDILDDVQVNDGKAKHSFTVIRDARDRNQWYYIPPTPRLYEKSENGQLVPEFSLIRYQFADPNDNSKSLEGGIMQFAATMQLSADETEQIKQYLIKNYQGTQPRLSALPIKKGTVVAYTPTSGADSSHIFGRSAWGNGIVPTFASQKMGFSFDLTNIGTDVMEKIATGNTGIPTAVVYTYLGLTPKAGFQVEVDYDQTYHHYSENSEIRAQASYFGWAGVSYSRSAKLIYDDLVNNKCIKVNIIAGENFDLSKAYEYLQPILARINTELVQAMTPPALISPAEAQAPTASGRIFSAGYSVALKDVTQRKTGREIIDFSVQQIIERNSIASGFIGIGKYDPQVRQSLVVTVPPGPIRSAYLVLPTIFDPQFAKSAGVRDIHIQTGIKRGDMLSQGELYTWTPSADKWTDVRHAARTFALLRLLNDWTSDFKDLKFTADIDIATNYGNISFPQEIKAFDGQQAVGRISESNVDIISVNPTFLAFNKIDASSKLKQISINVKCGELNINKSLAPYKINSSWQEPDAFQLLLKKSGNPVFVTIKGDYIGGEQRFWTKNGQDVRALGLMSIALDESELK